MQVKLLSALVEELAGENTGTIADILFNKKDVNEFLIAKKMELTINQVRNILYKLSNHGLVSFIRKKDTKRGWYIYYWTLNAQKCLEMIRLSLETKINEFTTQINSRETDRYYICHSCGIEVDEEKALESGFTCDECADIYELSDNSPFIRDLKGKRTRTQKELETIQGELKELHDKEERKKKRAANKAKKELNAQKELLKKAKEAAKKKLAATKEKTKKTATKKTTKKKTTKATTAKKKVTKKTTATKKKVSKEKATKKSTKKKTTKKKA